MGTDQFLGRPLLGLLSNLPVLLGALALLLPLWPPFAAAFHRRPAVWVLTLFLFTRVVFLGMVVGTLGHISSDLTGFFLPQADAIRAGQVPYRDFGSSYAPLFPYLLSAAGLILGNGAGAIFAVFVLADFFALNAVRSAARDREKTGHGTTPTAGWYYAAAPVVWYFLVRYAQDETVLAAFLAGAYLLHSRRRESAAALLLGLGFVATKFTFGIFVVPFFLASRSKLRFALWSALPVALTAGVFTALGASVLSPLRYESASLGDGPGLWRLPLLFTPLTLGRGSALIPLIGLLATWAWMWRRRYELTANLILTGCVFFLLSPKAFPMYVVPMWPMVSLWLARDPKPKHLVTVAVLNLLLGCWWYLDAGGVHGMFGPAVQGLAIAWTAAIPVVLGVLAWQVSRTPGEAGP